MSSPCEHRRCRTGSGSSLSPAKCYIVLEARSRTSPCSDCDCDSGSAAPQAQQTARSQRCEWNTLTTQSIPPTTTSSQAYYHCQQVSITLTAVSHRYAFLFHVTALGLQNTGRYAVLSPLHVPRVRERGDVVCDEHKSGHKNGDGCEGWVHAARPERGKHHTEMSHQSSMGLQRKTIE